MAPMGNVFINLTVIKKALERIDKSLGTGTAKRYFPKADDWLKGKSKPTFRQLEQLAQKALLPLELFFLEDVPMEELSYVYFRARGRKAEASPELEHTISVMKIRQNFLSAYLQELGWGKNKLVGNITIEQGIEETAKHIRNLLALHSGWAKAARSWSEAFDMLRDRVEALDIFVFTNNVVDNNNHRKLDPEEFSGFSLIDVYAPVIFVNTADYISSQIFTLMHELCHICLGIQEEGIFSFGEVEEYKDRVEVFCNRVAGEVLVPSEELRDAFVNVGKDYEYLAKMFKVSQAVIGIRLMALGLITMDEYEEEVKGKYEVSEELQIKTRETKGGNFYRIQRKKLGNRFIEIVRSALHSGFLTYTDAFNLTNLRGKSFYKLVEEGTIGSVHS